MSQPFEASWPSDVVGQAARRNLLLIFGAGVSAASSRADGSRPPGWAKLLKDVASGLGLGKSREFGRLMRESRHLDAASFLRSEARRLSKEKDFFTAIEIGVDGPPGDSFAGNSWHDAIIGLEPDLLVTTNFDGIFERASQNGFVPHRYRSTHVGREVRKGAPILLKIHGGVGEIEDIVLTRQDFARIRVEGAHALEVLQALLVTRTALLVGYSLHDPDLQLLFENVLGGRTEVPAHYLYCGDGLKPFEREILRDSYGVVPVTYPNGQHDRGLEGLQQLVGLVEQARQAGV